MRRAGFVAIIGRPNAGKSTLLNRVLGSELSVVTPKAQTTRERVLGILTEPKGQIVFIDTPGIHRAREGGINEYMVSEAREALEAPCCVWYLVDPRSSLEHEKPVLELLARTSAPVFVLMNKMDLVGRKIPTDVELRMRKVLETARPGSRLFEVSALRGKGLTELLAATWELLPESPLYFPDEEQLSDRPVRFFVSEKIREQLYLKLGEELPYSCGVEIERFDEETPKGQEKPHIEATIYVERESQKGMVIGKSGTKIKEIGTASRRQIETFLGKAVFLGLRVKVLREWTRDPEAMKRLGYERKAAK